MASDPAILAKIEFSILRYRNGKGSFTALVSDLDACTLRIDADAPYKYELRSKWLDLEEMGVSAAGKGRSEPLADHRRMVDLVLDELMELARHHRA
ncbi:MAG: hypothetical protein KDC18_14925 [Alphaproteobacteria bacterium]|nr:hypothetical protein [Alphaproteobacteria bacterium]MCB9931320.1 hypothetical protein [Alphaproteobacteria bacterium]